MLDLSSLPRHSGDLLLVTDRVAAPADFVILGLLGPALKQSAECRSILVSFAQPLSHWSSIAARVSPSINIPAYTTKGAFTFVDAQPGAHDEFLRSIFERISKDLDDHEGPHDTATLTNLVVLDGITTLLWTGTSVVDITRFLRAVRALCFESNASLVVRHHLTSPDLDDLTRFLFSQSSVHMEVMPLSSGKSGSVSGEIALHYGPLSRCSEQTMKIGRSSATQYRLGDAGPFYFDRGTSTGVL